MAGVYHRTMKLRTVKTNIGSHWKYELQQLWVDSECNEIWKAVPIVEVTED